MLTRKLSLIFAFALAATFSLQVSAHAHLKNQMIVPLGSALTHDYDRGNGHVLSSGGQRTTERYSSNVK